MRVLDLDLDFFLNEIAYFRADDCSRLPSEDYKPWSVSKVRRFLEDRCGLSSTDPVEGKIVEHHDGAFDFWHYLIETKRLSAPFDVTHVDGHSDLGLADSGYCYLMAELLHYEPEQRMNIIERKYVNLDNYVAFAIACRWIQRLQWIRHPDGSDDLPYQYFKRFPRRFGVIQLRKVDKRAFINFSGKLSFEYPPSLAFEPEVSFEMLSWRSFKNVDSFDYIVLSKSPGFTPGESDQLIPIIAEYIRQI